MLQCLQKLLFATGQYERALTIIEQAIEFGVDSAYIYNKGLIFDQLGMKAKAAEAMDSYLAMDEQTRDIVTLGRIALIYQNAERTDDAKRILAKMKSIDSRRTSSFVESYEKLQSLLA